MVHCLLFNSLSLSLQAMHENKVLKRTSITIKRMDSGNFKAQVVRCCVCVCVCQQVSLLGITLENCMYTHVGTSSPCNTHTHTEDIHLLNMYGFDMCHMLCVYLKICIWDKKLTWDRSNLQCSSFPIKYHLHQQVTLQC